MSENILLLEDINIYNSDRSVRLLKDININIKENKFYVVLGENGAGKSTLLYTMQGEVNRYVVEGKRKSILPYIPLLTQQVEHYFVGQTAWEEFVLTLESSDRSTTEAAKTSATKAEANTKSELESTKIEWLWLEINRVVNLLDLHSILHQPLHQLSGGQLQLVALASLLLLNVRLILVDEMTTMLDAPTRKMMLERMRHIQKETGCTIVYVTHAVHEIQYADYVISINHNQVSTQTRAQFVIEQKVEEDVLSHTNTIANEALLRKSTSYKDKISQIRVNKMNEKGNKTVLFENYSFRSHILTYINGRNGAGKSTLLKSIAGELEDTANEIILDDEYIIQRKLFGMKINRHALRHISYCPQFLHYVWSKDHVFEECLYAMKCSSMSLHTKHKIEGEGLKEGRELKESRKLKESGKLKDDKELKEHIEAYLSYFFIDVSLFERQIYSLSAGQQRRLALAISFMVETNWLLLDEPFAYLDHATSKRLAALIEARVKQGCGILLVSHEQHHISLSDDQINHIEIVRQDNRNYQTHDNRYKQSLEEICAAKGKYKNKETNVTSSYETKSALYLFHPAVLLIGLLILSIVIFLYANVAQLMLVFILAIVVNVIVLKGRIIGLLKLIVTFSLFIFGLAYFSALQLPQWTIDTSHLHDLLLYGYKLLTMILLTFSLFELISPFRLMRVLQQVIRQVKGSQQTAIKLYIIVIIFRFMTILQLLWGSLVRLYRVKYKRYVYEAPISFLTHFLRETLFIAEAIIINYELRQPLKLSSVVYKVRMRAIDYVLLSTLILLSVFIVML